MLLKGTRGRVGASRRVVRSWNVICCRGSLPRRATGRGTAAAPAVEELHVVGDDLGRPPLLAVLAFPRAGLDAPLDVDERPLAGVLGADLGEISLAGVVGHDVVVVGELLLFAVRSCRPPVVRV